MPEQLGADEAQRLAELLYARLPPTRRTVRDYTDPVAAPLLDLIGKGYAGKFEVSPWEQAAAALPITGIGRAAQLGKAALFGQYLLSPDEAQAKFKASVPAAEMFGLGQFKTTTPREIMRVTGKKGGYSVNLPTGEKPSEGLMMGIYPNLDPRTGVLSGKVTAQDIIEHARRNKVPLAQLDKYFGTWLDPESGKTYLDVSRRFNPDEIRQATKFGERTAQISGYDVGRGESFPVGNLGEFLQGPEYAKRLQEMAARGNAYLKQYDAPEWWSTPNMTRVYGEQNMPQMAGFMGATAPGTAPRPNTQTASEYMRRYITGEDIIQPDWRTPADTMSRNPGKMIGMEATRIANLEKAAQGDLQALQREKVREEALALRGDPRAVVIDRHQIRLAEKPEAGVYVGTTEGAMPSGIQGSRTYDAMKRAISAQADAVGRDPRDYSADVWAGIRETIKNENQLYGMKFRGAAVPGESKSYDDHFADLLRDKAKHLGISVLKLEQRLRNGDAELLSAVLGTPAIATFVSQFSGGGSEAR